MSKSKPFSEILKEYAALISLLVGLVTALLASTTKVIDAFKNPVVLHIFVSIVIIVFWGLAYYVKRGTPRTARGNRYATISLWSLPFILFLFWGYNIYIDYRASLPPPPCDVGKICVVIADFAVGRNQEGNPIGAEISQLIERELSSAVLGKGLEQKVEIRTITVVRDEEYAADLREMMVADILIWGWLTEPIGTSDQQYAVPSFILDIPLEASPDTPPPFQYDIVFNNTGQLVAKISDTATILISLSLAEIYIESKDYHRATLELDDAIRLAKQMQDKLKDQVDKGTSAPRELEEFNRGLARLFTARGLAHQLNKDFDQANADFEESARLDQDSDRPYIAIGNLHYVRLHYKLAKESYEIALSHNYRSYAAYYGLGSVAFVQGDFDEASRQYQEAIEISEYLGVQFPLAHYALGLTLLKNGKPEAARDTLQRAHQLAEGDSKLSYLVKDALDAVNREIALRNLRTISPQPSPTITASRTYYPMTTTPITTATVATPRITEAPPSATYAPTPTPTFSAATRATILTTSPTTASAVLTPTPTFTPTSKAIIQHVVESGETLRGIAMQYRVSEESIATANNLAPPYPLQVGQLLMIPGPSIIVAPPPTPRLPKEVVGGYIVVVTQGREASIRQGPGRNHIQVGVLNEGERLYVTDGPSPDAIGDSLVWLKVRNDTGVEGWVREEFLEEAPLLSAPILLDPSDYDAIENPDIGKAKLSWASDYLPREGEAFLVTIEYVASLDGTREVRLDEHWVSDSYELDIPNYLTYLVDNLDICTWTVKIVLLKEEYTDSAGNTRYHSRIISYTSQPRHFILEAWKPGVPAPDTSVQPK